jgi:DNA-binding CsgD family transcriptional regulator
VDQREACDPAVAGFNAADAALRLIAQLHQAALVPDTWVRVCGLASPLFGTRKAALLNVDSAYPGASQSFVVGLDPELSARLLNRNLESDLLYQKLRRLPVGSVVLGSEVLTEEQSTTGTLWHELAVPGGLKYRLCAVLENRAEQYTTFAVMRSGSEFTAAEKDLMRILLPHLQQVLTVSRRLQQAEAGRREFVRMLDGARQAMVILDRSGYALLVNRNARAILDSSDGATLKFGRFLFDEVAVQSWFETTLRHASNHSAGNRSAERSEIRVGRSSGNTPLELVVIPVHRPSDRALMPEGCGCMVVINDPALPQVIAPERLVRLYGLTGAEAKVCEALLATGSASEAAERLHIASNTARSHLKSIFGKIGVANQAQLMQRLTMLSRPPPPADAFGSAIPTIW